MAGGYLNVPTDAERNYQQRIVDSKGQAGPTLQRVADLYKTHKNNTGMLESLFEALAPLGMYSGDAEGAYIPSQAMKNAQGLAKVFQDWYKGGTPTINVPFEKWSDIIKSGKFKNQMELAGPDNPLAWKQRMEVEKDLGGFPYPRSVRGKTEALDNYYKNLSEHMRMYEPDATNKEKLEYLKDLIERKKEARLEAVYSESLAKQNPVYGHIYNTKYTHPHTAMSFGNTHAEMSDLVKDQSKYILGDSFDPFIEKAFSSDDMLGNTSRLERALFNQNRPDWTNDQLKLKPQNAVKYMEMWVPNHLARLNNVKGVYVPRKLIDSVDYGDIRAITPKEIPKLNDWNALKGMQEDMNILNLRNPINSNNLDWFGGHIPKTEFEHEPFSDDIPF